MQASWLPLTPAKARDELQQVVKASFTHLDVASQQGDGYAYTGALENTYLGHTQIVISFQNFQIHHNLTELFMMVPE